MQCFIFSAAWPNYYQQVHLADNIDFFFFPTFGQKVKGILFPLVSFIFIWILLKYSKAAPAHTFFPML